MTQTVEKGKTLLIDGPACVNLLSGKVAVLGAQVKVGDKVVVRKGKRMPFEALNNAQIELTLGDSASYAEIDESAIPTSWRDIVDQILAKKEQQDILVLGGVDSGKTGFCTYLANLALDRNRKVALVDGDLGQSDIGPPGTMCLSLICEPIVDFFNLRPKDAIFLGVTSPSRTVDAALSALASLKAKASELDANLLIVNTDGWVEGEGAVEYKVRLVDAISPDLVVALRSDNEMSPILDALTGVKISVIDSPKTVKKRDRETRKVLRGSAYKKHLKGAKVRLCPISWVKVEGDLEIGARNEYQLKRKIEDLLGKEIVYCRETSHCVVTVFERGQILKEEETKKLETEFDKQVITLQEGDEEGLLVALADAHGRYLGIGTLYNIDFRKGVMRINTPAKGTVSKIRISQIKLDQEGNEIDFAETPV